MVGTQTLVQQRLWNKCRRIGQAILKKDALHATWSCTSVPEVAQLDNLVQLLRAEVQALQKAARPQREKAWREKIVEDWSQSGAATYQWCKGDFDHKADMVERKDGSLTADPVEMDSLMHDAWMPVFQMYASKDQPSWEDFETRFGQHFAAKHEMHLNDLNGEKLLQVLRRLRSKSAPGMDSWKVDELKKLPVVLLDRSACMFNVIEETGLWPHSLTKGLVSLLSKGEGSKPANWDDVVCVPFVGGCACW